MNDKPDILSTPQVKRELRHMQSTLPASSYLHIVATAALHTIDQLESTLSGGLYHEDVPEEEGGEPDGR